VLEAEHLRIRVYENLIMHANVMDHAEVVKHLGADPTKRV
jgi:hypothetical protein